MIIITIRSGQKLTDMIMPNRHNTDFAAIKVGHTLTYERRLQRERKNPKKDESKYELTGVRRFDSVTCIKANEYWSRTFENNHGEIWECNRKTFHECLGDVVITNKEDKHVE